MTHTDSLISELRKTGRFVFVFKPGFEQRQKPQLYRQALEENFRKYLDNYFNPRLKRDYDNGQGYY